MYLYQSMGGYLYHMAIHFFHIFRNNDTHILTSNYAYEIASRLLSTPRMVLILQCSLCCEVCSTSCQTVLCRAVLCKGYHKPKDPCCHMLHIHLPYHIQEELPCTVIVYLGMAINSAIALSSQAIVRQSKKKENSRQSHRQDLTPHMLLAHLNIQLLDDLNAAFE